MTYRICYWDSEAREQRERDATVEETEEIEARIATAPAALVVRQLEEDADAAIKAEATVDLVKPMKWVDYNVWWSGKNAAFKDAVLKYMLWVLIKRVLS
jgi:hypothetical protein